MPADVRAQVPPDVVEIERGLSRISHLLSRARQHHQIATEAGVPIDRAAVPILRLLAEAGPQRPGDVAARLAVEAPHVTRQVQRLESIGYVERVPDPADRRAYRIRLTAAGREGVDRILGVGCQSILQALSDWTPQERAQLATLFNRMVDDFVRHAAERGVLPR
ncbi:MarR family transcriptional regulator [Phytohabitans sp. ZYX-F-186]|uniref:MarR family transcriptional regulator n=1 Tax=Phytohabitans maris TaxID=3071409 RepID=A0ABU0ZFJ5_9ACTN|nr:MarR family transcriptional regulator [Phytohabitans sp. ZYX-F-186]MDQ7905075.1 MarR family transcriptional regulator [Phytohabitans sp. ZYX-F-186]